MPEQVAAAPEATTTPSPETTPPVPTQTPPTDSAPAEETSLLSEAPKTEEAPKAEEAPPPPEPFDAEKIIFPAGMSKDDALFTEFTDIAKKHGLSSPAAQTFIDLAAKQVEAAVQRQSAEWAKQVDAWQAEVKADKEIGGDRLDQSLQTFAKVAGDPTLSDPGLRQALAFTGAGNHPAIVRTLVKWAAALSEGRAVSGGPGGSGRAPETLGQAIYGRDGPYVGGPKFS